MKPALHWKALQGSKVQCELCPRSCVILEGRWGNCGARKNIGGKLCSMVYGMLTSAAIDPIEKKPLYHFMPGSKAFSIGTAGCNMHCKHCQNWEISQAKAGELEEAQMLPEEAAKQAKETGCKSIAFTYNEPTVFYEYCLDTAKLARKKGIKTVLVSNGYISIKPLKEIAHYIDAANIDLKAFDDRFYRDVAGAQLKPVLDALKVMKQEGIWIELTNLIIPGMNDNMDKIEKMCKWVAKELGKEVPMHFTAFYPQYKMLDKMPTAPETLEKAAAIGRKYLDYVYTGNVSGESNTHCPKCSRLLVRRVGYRILENNIKKGKCSCGNKIAGIWG